MPGSVRGGGIPAGVSPSQQAYMPVDPAAPRPAVRPNERYPGPRASDQQPYRQPGPVTNPAGMGTYASFPGAKPTRVLRTDKTVLHVIKSLDPRGGDAALRGTAAGVNLVKNPRTNCYFVEKIVRFHSPAQRTRVQAEVDALMQVAKHGSPRSINMIMEHFWDRKSALTSIILEHCDRGTVGDLIMHQSRLVQQFNEPFVWHILAGLMKAIYFCHTGIDADKPQKPEPVDWNTLCHLDIKPSNVFLSSQEAKTPFPRVVLGDFGCVTTWKDIEAGSTRRDLQMQGTPGWFPPECSASSFGGWEGKYGTPTDIWQAGGVVQAMCRLVDMPDMTAVDRQRACGRLYSKELNDVVTACLQRDPTRRPRASDVIQEVKKRMVARGLVF